jgi:hypothetical protein
MKTFLLRILRTPLLCTALAGPAFVTPSVAFAQPTSVETERARALQKEGDTQFSKKEWAKARTAYIAAWAVLQHWSLAASLGDTELRMGLHQEAAEHLALMLTMSPPDDVRNTGESLLVEAKKHVGTVVLQIEPAGTDVSINGEFVGKSPLPTAVFLKPGVHTVELKKVGFLSRGKTLDVKAGSSLTEPLTLEPESQTGPKGPGGPEGPKGPQGPQGPEGPGKKPPPEPAPVWPTVVLAGASVAGIGLGITFTALSAQKASDIDETTACPDPVSAACLQEVDDLRSAGNAFQIGAIVSFVVGGLAGVGALTYAIVTSSSDEPAPSLSLVPHVGADFAGATLLGTF